MKTASRSITASAVIGAAVWVAAQSQIQAGYSVLTPDAGSSVPAGSALFSFRAPENINDFYGVGNTYL
jgi:hypothetical protein